MGENSRLVGLRRSLQGLRQPPTVRGACSGVVRPHTMVCWGPSVPEIGDILRERERESVGDQVPTCMGWRPSNQVLTSERSTLDSLSTKLKLKLKL